MDERIKDFEALFRKYFKLLCVAAMNHVHDTQVAEDIVQEFFVSYWQRKEKVQLIANFQAYAIQAVKYRSIDYLRKQAVIDNHSKTLETEAGYDPQEEEDQASLKYSKYLRILELIAQLPEARRKILVMHAFDKLSYAEIARRQDVSINTVRTQLSRAYAMLRSKAIILLLLVLYYFL